MSKEKVSISDLLKMKKDGKKIVAVSLYDYPTAVFAEEAGVDVVLVGDGSVGMTALGYKSTIPVTMDEMIIFCKAVARGASHPIIIGDMPFMSYHTLEEALRNAGRLIKEAGIDAVKLEGGKEICEKVRGMCDTGIPVVGHIGLTPQSASLLEGYKVHGMTAHLARKILEDAIALERSGIFTLVIEYVTVELAQLISEKLSIPVIGWGSGPKCDGVGLNISDVLGLRIGLTPAFAKQYANLHDSILNAMVTYKKEVEEEKFPQDSHSIHMDKAECEKLLQKPDD